MFKKIILIMLSLLTVTIFTNNEEKATSNTYSGSLVFVRGTATVIRYGRRFPGTVGLGLYQSDTVLTSAGSTAFIRLTSGASIKVSSGSMITLSLLRGRSGGNTGVHLHRGGVYANVNRLRGGSRGFRVDTPSSVAGVRGTLFYVESKTDKNSLDRIAVKHGKVHVKNLKEQNADIDAGYGIENKNGNLSKPGKYSWVKRLDWNMKTFSDVNIKENLKPFDYNKLDRFSTGQ